MAAHLDDSAWPILLISLGELSVHRFDEFTTWYEAALVRAADEGIAIITVALANGPPPSAEVTRHISACLRSLSDEPSAGSGPDGHQCSRWAPSLAVAAYGSPFGRGSARPKSGRSAPSMRPD